MTPNAEAPVIAESSSLSIHHSKTLRSCSASDQCSDGATPEKQKQTSSKGQRKSSSLPPETVEYLKAWMMSPEHVAHPYPTEQEKAQIMADTGIELKQLTNWFVNNRKRYWKPRVEARLQQQAQVNAQAAAAAAAAVAVSHAVVAQNHNEGNMTFSASPGPFICPEMRQPPPLPAPKVEVSKQAVLTSTAVDTSATQTLFLGYQQEHHRSVAVNTSIMSDSSMFENLSNPPNPVSVGSASVSESDNNSISNDDDDDANSMSTLPVSGSIVSFTANQDNSPSVISGYIDEINQRIAKATREDFCNGNNSIELTPVGRSRSVSDSAAIVQTLSSGATIRRRTVSYGLYDEDSEDTSQHPSSKRMRIDDAHHNRVSAINDFKKPYMYRTTFFHQDMEKWKEACRQAKNVYDDALPSLEEAAHMFGYSV